MWILPTCSLPVHTSHLPSGYQEVDLFSEIRGVNFDNVFGSAGGQPQTSSAAAASPFANSSPQKSTTAPPLMGGILQPQAVGPLASSMTPPQPQRLTKDVDSSLARAAENLSMSSLSSNSTLVPFATSTSPWSVDPQTRGATVVGNIDTGRSSWTTANSSGQLQPGSHGGPGGALHEQQPTKSPFDDIIASESLFAGTVV